MGRVALAPAPSAVAVRRRARLVTAETMTATAWLTTALPAPRVTAYERLSAVPCRGHPHCGTGRSGVPAGKGWYRQNPDGVRGAQSRRGADRAPTYPGHCSPRQAPRRRLHSPWRVRMHVRLVSACRRAREGATYVASPAPTARCPLGWQCRSTSISAPPAICLPPSTEHKS